MCVSLTLPLSLSLSLSRLRALALSARACARAGGRDGAAALLSLFNSVSAPDSPRGAGGQQLARHRGGSTGDYFGQVPGQVLLICLYLYLVCMLHAVRIVHALNTYMCGYVAPA